MGVDATKESMMRFHVLIPSYNCGEWIERCLSSVATQSVLPDQVLLIDDASSDSEYSETAERLCAEYGFRYHRNDVNMKCPRNLRIGIDLLDADDEDVIFLLDGDDFLPTPVIMERFHSVYADREVWFTYGNVESHPYDTGQTRAAAYPIEIIFEREFRKESNFFNHPLTFRKFLWDGIEDSDMQDSDGEWFVSCYDQVIALPLLEMAGGTHYRFLDETLYAYNSINPLSEIYTIPDDRPKELYDRPKKGRMYR